MVGMTLLEPIKVEANDLIIRPGPFTIADREAMPDERYRHELIDGVLVMSPRPRLRHQDIAGEVFILLKAAAPAEFKVVQPPFDIEYGDDTAIQPDAVATLRTDADPSGVTTRPLLAVEVASPSTRLFDLGRKKEILAEIGCPSYWTIEPDAGPELTVWTLVDGSYVKETVVTGADAWTASLPFPVTVVPAQLLDE